MPGEEDPLTIKDCLNEVKKYKKLQLYSVWQTGVICYSSYLLGKIEMVGDNFGGKLRVLTFSIN